VPDLIFELVKPANKSLIGREAIQMVSWADMLARSAGVRRRFEDVVRDGFAYNFDVEGVPSGQWRQLAEMTVEERRVLMEDEPGGLVPGFGPEHPILQRTGRYRASWTDADDPDALLLLERSDPGSLVMYIGSSDPRVPKLSGGRAASIESAMASEGIEYQSYSLGELGEGFFVEQAHPWGRIEPRPVHELFDQFEQLLTALGESFGNVMAEAAK
jgi:hypothetical protein